MTSIERSMIKLASASYTLCCRGCEGWLRRPHPFIQLSLLHSCSLWQARPWPLHTDRSNGPATCETSFSDGERATITTLFVCGSHENRELTREASECAHAHGKYHISLTGGRRLLQSQKKHMMSVPSFCIWLTGTLWSRDPYSTRLRLEPLDCTPSFP